MTFAYQREAHMNLLTLKRQPVPSHDPRHSHTCERRGFHGPFANEGFYDAFPEAHWHGMGDCLECGTTRKVAIEIQKAIILPSAA
jgi:hypothetical protein